MTLARNFRKLDRQPGNFMVFLRAAFLTFASKIGARSSAKGTFQSAAIFLNRLCHFFVILVTEPYLAPLGMKSSCSSLLERAPIAGQILATKDQKLPTQPGKHIDFAHKHAEFEFGDPHAI